MEQKNTVKPVGDRMRLPLNGKDVDSRGDKDGALEGIGTKEIVEQVNSIEAATETEGKGFGEDEKRQKTQATTVTGGATVKHGNGSVVAVQPKIDEMIKQTVAAIEVELKKNQIEMRQMIKNKQIAPYLINNKVKEIRFLNGILSELKRAARLAEDFIVGLWREYVRKT